MSSPAIVTTAICSLFAIVLSQCSQSSDVDSTPSAAEYITTSKEPIRPIPMHIQLDENKVALGRKLFHEPKLSHDDNIACSNCHDLSTAGTDGMALSIGINETVGFFNAPTVLNSGFNFRQFWDGRAGSLEEQIEGPIHQSFEMGSSWPEVIGKLERDASYVQAFAAFYPDGIKSDNIKDAIATFERSLYTPNSRLDRYLRGDAKALSPEEEEGYRLFKSFGCVACHQGIGVGGNMFQVFGIMGNYFADRGNIKEIDLGRFNITGDEEDRYVFKVPSLRNVALTAPYFHDGSVERLQDAVRIMARYQLGHKLISREIELLTKFLGTLTGEYDEGNL